MSDEAVFMKYFTGLKVTSKQNQSGYGIYLSQLEKVYIEKIGHSIMIIQKQKSKWDVMRNALSDLSISLKIFYVSSFSFASTLALTVASSAI